MSTIAAPAPPERASLADWLAVVAGMIGTLMALMDVSIVNSSLPTIQGEIGATASEATWVNTSYLVAEIVIIPLTAWLQRMLGMRTMLLGGAALFTVFSVVCGFATSLTMLVVGRIGQGLCGGVLIPTAMTLVATRLPPAQQPVGLAITGMAALLGPVFGPLVGGWLTENFSWHYAFFINVPICAFQATLLMIGIKGTTQDWSELRNADWLGIGGMVIGLGSATVLLEEGHREQWFDSPFIWQLAGASLVGFAMIAAGQFRRGRPVLRFSLLRNGALTSAVLLLAVLGMLIFTTTFMMPQFLVAIAGYTALQAGVLTSLSGIISICTAILYTGLIKFFDLRWIVAFALICASLADYLLSGMTIYSTGRDFLWAQLLFGLGTTLSAIPLQQAVISSVPPEDASEANAFGSVTRNLGGSIGLAGLASFQDGRFEFHRWNLHSSLSANDPAVQDTMAQAGSMLGTSSEATEAIMRMVDGEIMRQALVMTFNDIFLGFAIMGVIMLPLILLLRPPPKDAPMGGGH